MKWAAMLFAVAMTTACGGPARPARHSGPDVVTAEWTSGDDAPLGESE